MYRSSHSSHSRKNNISLREYDLRNIKAPSTIVIFGKHGTGKTTFVKWVMYFQKHRIRLPLVISESADSSGDFDGIVPDTLLWNSYDPEKMTELIKSQKKLRILKEKMQHPDWVNKEIRAFVVMDDILGDTKWANDSNLKLMFFNGRHSKISLVMGIQEVMALKKKFRGDIDYTVITSLTTEQAKEDVYKYYWNDAFGNKRDCINIINACTKGHKVLIIDQKKVATAMSAKECVFYYNVPHPAKLPKFRIGSKRIWHLHKKVYDSKWEMREAWGSSKKNSQYKKYEKPSSRKNTLPKKKEEKRIVLV